MIIDVFSRFETHLCPLTYLLDGYIWIFYSSVEILDTFTGSSPFWCAVDLVVSTTSWIVLAWNIRGLGMRSCWIRRIFPANYFSFPSNAHLANRRVLSVRRSFPSMVLGSMMFISTLDYIYFLICGFRDFAQKFWGGSQILGVWKSKITRPLPSWSYWTAP